MLRLRARSRLCGKALQLAQLATEIFDLTSTLPAFLTMSRNDAVATYRNSSGVLVNSTANAARFDHDVSGNALGLMVEEGRTNYCTTKNYSPADTSGYTLTGTVTSTRVYTPATLTAVKLDTISPGGYMLQFNGGASGGTVAIGGTIGATGKTSVSIYSVYISGPAASIGITPSPTAKSLGTSTTLARYKAENLTATATSDQMIITLPAWAVVRVILHQMERGTCCTSEILVNGATATRNKEFISDLSIATRDFVDFNKGGCAVLFKPYQEKDTANVQGIFVFGNTTFPTQAFYTQTNQTSGKPHAYAKEGSNSYNGSAQASLLKDQYNPVCLSWNNGSKIELLAGSNYKEIPMTSSVSGIDRFILGAFAGNTWQVNGHFKSLMFFKDKTPTLNELAIATIPNTEKAIITGGQSNIANYTLATIAELYINDGERAFIDQLNLLWTTSRNSLINSAIGGTFIVSWRGTGDSITKWKKMARAYLATGATIEAIVWDQGESDMGLSTALFKQYYKEIFDDMRTVVGEVPVILVPLGQYKLNSSDTHKANCALHRQAYRELVSENAWIHMGPEKYFNVLIDSIVHYYAAGYAEIAKRVARKTLKVLGETITGGVDGPSISGVGRASTSVTITITHDGGTDITPGTAADGFVFKDDGTPIAWTTKPTRASATTLVGVLSSTPSGVETLEYCNDSLYDVDPTKVVMDNNTIPMPLKSAVITL